MKRLQPGQLHRVLWTPQKHAIQACEQYLNRKNRSTAYLIRMPTGTGKTAVIGYVARSLTGKDNVLVLSPWAHLRNQTGRALVDEASDPAQPVKIGETIWQKLGIMPPYDKDLFSLLPSKVHEIPKRNPNRGYIIVGTIAALERIFAEEKKQDYDYLKSLIDVVVVDEGHYEPAAQWAQAIRGLRKATILFTATPYRNDLKLFRVEDGDIYEFTHEASERQGLIRGIKFIHPRQFEPTRWDYYKQFVDELLEYVDNHLKRDSRVLDPRIIIRCNKSFQIARIAGYLRDKGRQVIGIHDTFENNEEDYLVKTVPDPKHRKAQFWVHQHKLTEGLDDARFAQLAIFSNFRNQRALVQQVGRVLRVSNPPTQKKPSKEKGVIFAPRGFKVQESWSRYRTYEVTRKGTRSETLEILDELLRKQPEAEYFDRKFRERFRFDNDSPHEQLIYRLSARVARLTNKFDWQVFKDNVYDELSKDDRIIRREHEHRGELHIWLYALAGNCPLLREHALLEFRLGYAIAVLRDDLLFFHDSEGMTWFPYLEKTTRGLMAVQLQQLIPNKGSVAKAVSLKSALLGKQLVRGQVLRAQDIAQTPQALIDNLQVCSRVEATVPSILRHSKHREKPRSRRYVSLGRGRVQEDDVSEDEADGASLATYLEWTRQIARTIKGKHQPAAVFERYAPPVAPPTNPGPDYILLDLNQEGYEIIENSSGSVINHETLDFAKTITHNDKGISAFRLTIPKTNNKDDEGDEEYEVTVHFSNDGRFFLRCPKLSRRYTIRTKGSDQSETSLISHLNHKQDFRISIRAGNLVYCENHFYQINYDVFADLVKNIVDIPALAKVTSEKGESSLKSGVMGRWPKGSVFDLVDLKSPNCAFKTDLQGITHQICDDPAPEAADFIAADLNNRDRVIFIHAKDGKGKKLSAQIFQEICAQATSKLGYLLLGSDQIPPKAKTGAWNNPWTLGGAKIKRWRKVPSRKKLDPSAVWGEIRSVVNNPNAAKEIWLVLGRGMSRKALLNCLNDVSKRPSQYMHLVYLLNSTWATITHAGVKMRLFCGYDDS